MQKRFTWTQEYSVGVAEIDEQHQQFIKICNSLIDLTETSTFTRQEALISIMRFGDYASYHLGTEEEDFVKIHYAETEHHVEIHQIFRKTVQELINKVRDENSDAAKTLVEAAVFAAEWLLHHILVMDKRYTEAFHANGIV